MAKNTRKASNTNNTTTKATKAKATQQAFLATLDPSEASALPTIETKTEEAAPEAVASSVDPTPPAVVEAAEIPEELLSDMFNHISEISEQVGNHLYVVWAEPIAHVRDNVVRNAARYGFTVVEAIKEAKTNEVADNAKPISEQPVEAPAASVEAITAPSSVTPEKVAATEAISFVNNAVANAKEDEAIAAALLDGEAKADFIQEQQAALTNFIITLRTTPDALAPDEITDGLSACEVEVADSVYKLTPYGTDILADAFNLASLIGFHCSDDIQDAVINEMIASRNVRKALDREAKKEKAAAKKEERAKVKAEATAKIEAEGAGTKKSKARLVSLMSKNGWTTDEMAAFANNAKGCTYGECKPIIEGAKDAASAIKAIGDLKFLKSA